MSEIQKLLLVSALVSNLALAGPALDQAEVRLPYGELKSLIAGAARPEGGQSPDPSLLSARFRLSMVDGKPRMEATFRTTTFADGVVKIPLAGGDLTVESQQPPEARVLINEEMLCQAVDKVGTQILELNLLPSFGADGMALVVPPCPAAVFETEELGEEWSVSLKIDAREQVLGSNQKIALPLGGGRYLIRMLGGEETREALRPPEPSSWTWQQQALVIPEDGEIVYRVLASASAAGGSGVSASLGLPPDAREVQVIGDDLIRQKLARAKDRSLKVELEWKTRGVLEREIAISYTLPRRPLDRTWKLQAPIAPGDDSTRSRFIVASSPQLSYSADGLAGPFPPKGLPAAFADELKGASYYQLEAATAAELAVNPLPVVATAEGTVVEAIWQVKLEPDGAMLTEGTMELEHRGLSGVPLDVPSDLVLLSCNVNGQSVTPVNLGDGKIEISLPLGGGKSKVSCAFTGRTAAIDPVEGTLKLVLPKTSLYIRALTWKIDLPRGYQAEISGNLTRPLESADPPSRLTLHKNQCRDERPEINVFYQRSDLKN